MFSVIDMRIGRIVSAIPFVGARKPAYKLEVDLGPLLGVKRSSAQLTAGYPDPAQLVGRFVVAVVNFASRSIAGFKSEVLVTGFYADDLRVFLLEPVGSEATLLGSRISTCLSTNTALLPMTTMDQFTRLNKIRLGRVTSVDGTGIVCDCGSQIGAGIKCPPPASGTLPGVGDAIALLLRDTADEGADVLVTASGSLLTSHADVPLGTLLA